MKIDFLKKESSFLYNILKNKYILSLFNKKTNNKIDSSDVHLKSIIGHDIEVMKGTHICQNSVIGSYTYIGFNTLISKTTIGRYNSIASNVNIGHGEHPLNLISTNTLFIKDPYEQLTVEDCIIENDVWIGIGAIIKRGVKLGTGSVIGSNSFVNKDVPPYAIVVGSPARILKYRFPENKIQILLNSKWWEAEFEEAQSIIKHLEIVTSDIKQVTT